MVSRRTARNGKRTTSPTKRPKKHEHSALSFHQKFVESCLPPTQSCCSEKSQVP